MGGLSIIILTNMTRKRNYIFKVKHFRKMIKERHPDRWRWRFLLVCILTPFEQPFLILHRLHKWRINRIFHLSE